MSSRTNPIPARHSRARHLKKRSPTRRLATGVVAVVVLAGIGIALYSVLHSPATSASGKQGHSASSTTVLRRSSTSQQTSSTLASTTSTSTTLAPTTTTTALAPGDITLEVLNGSGAPGAAAAAAAQLTQAGFVVDGTTDAASFTYNASVIEYPQGMASVAQFVANHVQGAVTVQLDTSLTGTTLWFIAGSSFGGATAA